MKVYELYDVMLCKSIAYYISMPVAMKALSSYLEAQASSVVAEFEAGTITEQFVINYEINEIEVKE